MEKTKAVSAPADDAKGLWESEKKELLKARDDALAELKVPNSHHYPRFVFHTSVQTATEAAHKASEETKEYKLSTVSDIDGCPMELH